MDWATIQTLARPLVNRVPYVSVGNNLTVRQLGGIVVEIPIKTLKQAQEWNRSGIPLLAMLTDYGPRFYRECYITDKHVISWAKTEGMMEFAKIFTEADGRRWVVLRDEHQRFVLTDLWETTTNKTRERLFPAQGHTFADLDAAIAAAQLLL